MKLTPEQRKIADAAGVPDSFFSTGNVIPNAKKFYGWLQKAKATPFVRELIGIVEAIPGVDKIEAGVKLVAGLVQDIGKTYNAIDSRINSVSQAPPHFESNLGNSAPSHASYSVYDSLQAGPKLATM